MVCWVFGTAHILKAKVGHTLAQPCGLGCLIAVHIVHTGFVAERALFRAGLMIDFLYLKIFKRPIRVLAGINGAF